MRRSISLRVIPRFQSFLPWINAGFHGETFHHSLFTIPFSSFHLRVPKYSAFPLLNDSDHSFYIKDSFRPTKIPLIHETQVSTQLANRRPDSINICKSDSVTKNEPIPTVQLLSHGVHGNEEDHVAISIQKTSTLISITIGLEWMEGRRNWIINQRERRMRKG